MRPSSPQQIMDAALAMLGRRRYSTPRLRRRLLEKFADQDPEPVLQRLVELRLLDDSAYASDFVADRLRRRGQGRLKIKAALSAEGLDAEVISAAIASQADEGSEREQAREVLRKYLRRACGRRAAGYTATAVATDRGDRADADGGDHADTGRGAEAGESAALRAAAYRHLRSRGFADETVCDLLRESL